MKIRIIDRILLLLLVLSVIALGVTTLCILYGAIPHAYFTNFISFAFEDIWMQILISVIAIVAVLVCLRLLFAGMSKHKPQSALLHESPTGSVRVSLQVLEELAQRYVRSIKEIKELNTDIFLRGDGVKYVVRYTIAQDSSIPEISAKLKTGIKDYVEMYSGIPVKEIEIMVEKTSSPNTRFSGE